MLGTMVLNILRSRKFAKRVLLGVLILIIPAFVLWGVGNISQRPPLVGQIGRQKITATDLGKSAQGTRIQIVLAYFQDSASLNKILQNRALITHMAWERLIFLDAARSKHIKVTDKEVMQFISRHPLFQRNGVFDVNAYNYILRNLLNMQPHQFEEFLKDNLKISKFRQDLFKNINASDNELLALYRMANDKVDFSYILIDKEIFADKVSVDPDKVKKFYDENTSGFLSPPKADIEYIEFLYEDPSKRTVTIEKIKEIYPKLQKSPENLKKIAKENGLRYGKTGVFSRDEMMPGVKSTEQLHSVAFALEEGKISQPIFPATEKGSIYILRKVSHIPPAQLKFEEVKGGITEALLDAKSLQMAGEKATPLYERITKGTITLEDAGKVAGQVVKTAKGINSAGYIQNIGPARPVVTSALKSQEGNVISPITISEKGVILARVDKIIPADEAEFAAQKEKFRQNLLARKQMNAIDRWFEENAKRIKLHRSLSDL